MSEKELIKGFNDGYLMQKYQPDLASSLKSGFTVQDDPYVQGFNAGIEQLSVDKEQHKASFFEKMSHNAQSIDLENEKDQSLEQDKDLSL